MEGMDERRFARCELPAHVGQQVGVEERAVAPVCDLQSEGHSQSANEIAVADKQLQKRAKQRQKTTTIYQNRNMYRTICCE